MRDVVSEGTALRKEIETVEGRMKLEFETALQGIVWSKEMMGNENSKKGGGSEEWKEGKEDQDCKDSEKDKEHRDKKKKRKNQNPRKVSNDGSSDSHDKNWTNN